MLTRVSIPHPQIGPISPEISMADALKMGEKLAEGKTKVNRNDI